VSHNRYPLDRIFDEPQPVGSHWIGYLLSHNWLVPTAWDTWCVKTGFYTLDYVCEPRPVPIGKAW